MNENEFTNELTRIGLTVAQTISTYAHTHGMKAALDKAAELPNEIVPYALVALSAMAEVAGFVKLPDAEPNTKD